MSTLTRDKIETIATGAFAAIMSGFVLFVIFVSTTNPMLLMYQ